jgi:hypothetical protein
LVVFVEWWTSRAVIDPAGLELRIL